MSFSLHVCGIYLTPTMFELKGGMPRPLLIWTSGSKKGTVDGFRWCSSRTPLNISQFKVDDWTSNNQRSLLTLNCPTTFYEYRFFVGVEVGYNRTALCEEQPRWFKFCSKYMVAFSCWISEHMDYGTIIAFFRSGNLSLRVREPDF